ncbi:MAG: hypothetical protein K0V04_01380 [Deltaproteobacteria bacterium]|nr:hypothetical protein [Deltaproteobacteria bacterium]
MAPSPTPSAASKRTVPPTARWARRQLVRQLKRVPPLHRAAKELLVGAKLLRSRFRQAQRRLRGQAAPAWLQTTSIFQTPLRAMDADALHAELQQRGVTVQEGRHTLYLAPQEGLANALGLVVAAYPPTCGFKLLKRFAAPAQARYLHETDALGEAALLGGIHEQALATAALAAMDLGPRLVDVVHLRAGDVDITALVLEHIDGRSPTLQDHEQLLAALDQLQADALMTLANPSGYECGDFAAPGCNGNLLVTDDGLRYVDPQLFLFDMNAVIGTVVERHREVLHFGDRLGVVSQGKGFLYQGLPGRGDPGRRDPDDRWGHLDALLAAGGVTLRDRVVMDVCCNAGMMMAGALQRGAQWALGWDLPAVASAARELLPLLGAGRSTVTGGSIDDSVRFIDNVPPWLDAQDGVCLFLAAWHHVGFPPGIADLPWEWLVYEGREHEEAEITAANVATMEQRWECRAVTSQVITDGLCGPRPVVLLGRVDRH